MPGVSPGNTIALAYGLRRGKSPASGINLLCVLMILLKNCTKKFFPLMVVPLDTEKASGLIDTKTSSQEAERQEFVNRFFGASKSLRQREAWHNFSSTYSRRMEDILVWELSVAKKISNPRV